MGVLLFLNDKPMYYLTMIVYKISYLKQCGLRIFLCVNNKHSECEYGADVFCHDLILVFERLYILTCGHVTL